MIDDRAFRIGQLVRSVILFDVLLLLAWIGRFFVRRYLIRQTDEGEAASATTNACISDESFSASA